MGTIITFGASSALLIAFLGFRSLELRMGRTFFPKIREKADMAVLRAFVYARRGIVKEMQIRMKGWIVNMIHQLTLAALSVTRRVEERLVTFIGYMRERASRGRKKTGVAPTPSAFLKTVSDERREEREIR